MQLTEKQKSEGWRIVKFGEIARNVSKRVDPADTKLEVYVGLEHLDPDNLRITRRGVPSDVKGQKLLVTPGQIIFGKRRAYQRKVAVADFEGICSAHAMVLEAIPETVLPDYLPFFMQSDIFMERAVSISEGSLSPTIKWKTLANQEFPLPPRTRQEEMLEIFEKIEDCIFLKEDLVNVINLKLRKIILQNKQSPDWSLKRIDEVGEVVTGNTPPTQQKHLWDGDIPFITPGDILDGLDYVTCTERHVTNDGADKGRKIPENSVLVVCIGSTVGKVGINSKECITNQQINTIIPKEETDSFYLMEIIRHYKNEILANTSLQAVPIINKGNLSKIKIPVAPATVQIKLGDLLRSITSLKVLIDSELYKLRKIKQRILCKEL